MARRDIASEGIAGVLLAAGAGTRYGSPKVQAAQGEWLRRAITALAEGGCGDVVVVLGAALIDVPAPARAVIAADWARGQGASLSAGLDAVPGAEYVVVLTVDTPDIGAAVVARVLGAVRGSDNSIARAWYGARPGHPVVIGRRHWPGLRDAIRNGAGAKVFLAGRGDVLNVDCADLATGADIDYP